MKRKPGFYWVQIFDTWQVAEWIEMVKGELWCWNLTGSETPFCDGELDRIDERPISRPD
jgi:hypothetical protein